MSYRTAFPDFPDADMPPIPNGWFDASWKNDACPSFTCGAYRIFIDYADVNRRECPGFGDRFIVMHTLHTEEEICVFESDDFAAVVSFVTERTK